MKTNPDFRAAVAAIRRGGGGIYPTETLYGLGASALQPQAAQRVSRIKNRPESKPLPLVVGSREQVRLVTDLEDPDFSRLSELFWPGPLSVVVPARPGLAPLAMDSAGLTSLRWTAHPLAAALCLESETPLIATSANRSGQPPASKPDKLDPLLMAAVDAAVLGRPWPAGGPASTVVRLLGAGWLTVLRLGVVPLQALEQAGFRLADQDG